MYSGCPWSWGGPLYRWMVYQGKSQTKMDDLGIALFQETSIWLVDIGRTRTVQAGEFLSNDPEKRWFNRFDHEKI